MRPGDFQREPIAIAFHPQVKGRVRNVRALPYALIAALLVQGLPCSNLCALGAKPNLMQQKLLFIPSGRVLSGYWFYNFLLLLARRRFATVGTPPVHVL